MTGPWTPWEIEFLRINAPQNGFPWCAQQLNRTLEAVRLKGSRLKIRSTLLSTGPPKLPDETIRNGLVNAGLNWISGAYYGSIQKTLLVECQNGHRYSTSWNNIQQGRRCYRCFGTPRKTAAEIEAVVVAKNFTLVSIGTYRKNNNSITVRCKAGHEWQARFGNIRSGTGCPTCSGKMSSGQQEVIDFIKSIYPREVLVNDRQAIKPLELDIYLPEKQLAIEYHGLYWHSLANPAVRPSSHLKKHLAGLAKGIRVIQIFEDQWRDRRLLIEAMLHYRLGVVHKLRASKCYVKELTQAEADSFFNANHLDGSTRCFLSLGLMCNQEVVCAISFRKPYTRKHRGAVEIARFATRTGYKVYGGFSKLWAISMVKLKALGFAECLTYSDNTWGTGEVYRLAGFACDGLTVPNYWYTDGVKRIFRFACRKTPGLGTERTQQADLGRWRIYGAGHRRWRTTI